MLITSKVRLFKDFLLAALLCLSFGTAASCQTKPQTVDEIVKICQAFLDKDDLEGASECVQKAMFANPQKAEEISRAGTSAIFQKCHDFKNKKDYEKAIICYEGSTELMPNSANVQFNLADSYYEYFEKNGYKDADILERAEQAAEKGLQIRSDDVAAISLYARILRTSGKLDEALEQHKKLVKADPKSSLSWTGLGLTQQKLNQDNEAVKSFEQAVTLDPKNHLAYFFLGASYKKIGETNKAVQSLEKTLEIDPNNEEAKEELKKLKKELKSERPQK